MISFALNGRRIDLESRSAPGLTPTTTVLQFLRSLPGHSGTKEGCAEGDCGACTVVLASLDGDRLRYDAVDSCLLFLPMLHGRHLITVEGLRAPDGTLHPVQQALVDLHGSQCGFCTPGIVMSLFALARRSGDPPDDAGIRSFLAGNLCRCTGYRPIIDASRTVCAARTMDRFDRDEPRIAAMLADVPPTCGTLAWGNDLYCRPGSIADALAFRAEHPDAVIIGGATDVALRVTKRHERLPVVLDLSAVAGLAAVSVDDTGLTVGAGVTISRLESVAAEGYPLLSSLTEVFGSRQIRNLATVGGNIGTASPVGDALPVLIASDAEIVVTGPEGGRRVPASDFAVGYRTTACRQDELITAVRIPRTPADAVLRWYKVSKRRDVDIASVSGGFRLERTVDGRVRRIVLAYGGMADRTRRAAGVERFLTGRPWTRAVVEEALPYMDREFTPITDARGSAAMRSVAARNLLLKFWAESSP